MKVTTVHINYGVIRMEADVKPEETVNEAMDNLFTRHNVRKTSRDKNGNQRGIIEGPFGKTKVTSGTSSRTLI